MQTIPPEPQYQLHRQGAHPPCTPGGAGADDLSLLQQPAQKNGVKCQLDSSRTENLTIPKQQQSLEYFHRYPTRQQYNHRKTESDGPSAAPSRSKHGRAKSCAESQPASKRRVTTGADDASPLLQNSTSGTGPRGEWPAGPQDLRDEALQYPPQSDILGGMPLPGPAKQGISPPANVPVAGMATAGASRHPHVRRQALHSCSSPQASMDSSPARDQPGTAPSNSALAEPPGLPVSHPAVGALAVRHARDRALGAVVCQPPPVSARTVSPCEQGQALHPLDDFWPDAYDSQTLVSWVEHLISWQNPPHSRHALLMALYGLYVMKRLVQQVSFAPMSVVSAVALAAVVRHGLATTLPTIREQARAFQSQVRSVVVMVSVRSLGVTSPFAMQSPLMCLGHPVHHIRSCLSCSSFWTRWHVCVRMAALI